MSCFDLPQSQGTVEFPQMSAAFFSSGVEMIGDVSDVASAGDKTTLTISGRKVIILRKDRPSWLRSGIKMRIKMDGKNTTLEKLKK